MHGCLVCEGYDSGIVLDVTSGSVGSSGICSMQNKSGSVVAEKSTELCVVVWIKILNILRWTVTSCVFCVCCEGPTYNMSLLRLVKGRLCIQ